MKRKYRIMSDGTVYRIFPGGIRGSFCWPDMASVERSYRWHRVSK